MHMVQNEGRFSSVTDFTGISAPYEAPEAPEVHIKYATPDLYYFCWQNIHRTDEQDLAESVRTIVQYLEENKYI